MPRELRTRLSYLDDNDNSPWSPYDLLSAEAREARRRLRDQQIADIPDILAA